MVGDFHFNTDFSAISKMSDSDDVFDDKKRKKRTTRSSPRKNRKTNTDVEIPVNLKQGEKIAGRVVQPPKSGLGTDHLLYSGLV